MVCICVSQIETYNTIQTDPYQPLSLPIQSIPPPTTPSTQVITSPIIGPSPRPPITGHIPSPLPGPTTTPSISPSPTQPSPTLSYS